MTDEQKREELRKNLSNEDFKKKFEKELENYRGVTPTINTLYKIMGNVLNNEAGGSAYGELATPSTDIGWTQSFDAAGNTYGKEYFDYPKFEVSGNKIRVIGTPEYLKNDNVQEAKKIISEYYKGYDLTNNQVAEYIQKTIDQVNDQIKSNIQYQEYNNFLQNTGFSDGAYRNYALAAQESDPKNGTNLLKSKKKLKYRKKNGELASDDELKTPAELLEYYKANYNAEDRAKLWLDSANALERAGKEGATDDDLYDAIPFLIMGQKQTTNLPAAAMNILNILDGLDFGEDVKKAITYVPTYGFDDTNDMTVFLQAAGKTIEQRFNRAKGLGQEIASMPYQIATNYPWAQYGYGVNGGGQYFGIPDFENTDFQKLDRDSYQFYAKMAHDLVDKKGLDTYEKVLDHMNKEFGVGEEDTPDVVKEQAREQAILTWLAHSFSKADSNAVGGGKFLGEDWTDPKTGELIAKEGDYIGYDKYRNMQKTVEDWEKEYGKTGEKGGYWANLQEDREDIEEQNNAITDYIERMSVYAPSGTTAGVAAGTIASILAEQAALGAISGGVLTPKNIISTIGATGGKIIGGIGRATKVVELGQRILAKHPKVAEMITSLTRAAQSGANFKEATEGLSKAAKIIYGVGKIAEWGVGEVGEDAVRGIVDDALMQRSLDSQGNLDTSKFLENVWMNMVMLGAGKVVGAPFKSINYLFKNASARDIDGAQLNTNQRYQLHLFQQALDDQNSKIQFKGWDDEGHPVVTRYGITRTLGDLTASDDVMKTINEAVGNVSDAASPAAARTIEDIAKDEELSQDVKQKVTDAVDEVRVREADGEKVDWKEDVKTKIQEKLTDDEIREAFPDGTVKVGDQTIRVDTKEFTAGDIMRVAGKEFENSAEALKALDGAVTVRDLANAINGILRTSVDDAKKFKQAVDDFADAHNITEGEVVTALRDSRLAGEETIPGLRDLWQQNWNEPMKPYLDIQEARTGIRPVEHEFYVRDMLAGTFKPKDTGSYSINENVTVDMLGGDSGFDLSASSTAKNTGKLAEIAPDKLELDPEVLYREAVAARMQTIWQSDDMAKVFATMQEAHDAGEFDLTEAQAIKSVEATEAVARDVENSEGVQNIQDMANVETLAEDFGVEDVDVTIKDIDAKIKAEKDNIKDIKRQLAEQQAKVDSFAQETDTSATNENIPVIYRNENGEVDFRNDNFWRVSGASSRMPLGTYDLFVKKVYDNYKKIDNQINAKLSDADKSHTELSNSESYREQALKAYAENKAPEVPEKLLNSNWYINNKMLQASLVDSSPRTTFDEFQVDTLGAVRRELRNKGYDNLSPEMKARVDMVDNHFSQTQTNDMVLYRGETLTDYAKNLQPGDKIDSSAWSFMSPSRGYTKMYRMGETTANRSRTKGGVLYRYHTKTGQPIFYSPNATFGYDANDEMVLPRGIDATVTSVKDNKLGEVFGGFTPQKIIDVEVNPSGIATGDKVQWGDGSSAIDEIYRRNGGGDSLASPDSYGKNELALSRDAAQRSVDETQSVLNELLEKKQKLDDAEKNLKNLQETKNKLQEMKNKLQDAKASVDSGVDDVKVLDSEIAETKARILELEKQIKQESAGGENTGQSRIEAAIKNGDAKKPIGDKIHGYINRLNAKLHKGEDFDAEDRADAAYLDSMFTEKTKTQQTLYRYEPAGTTQKIKNGDSISQDFWPFTSTDGDYAKWFKSGRGGTLFKYDIPAGTPVLDVSPTMGGHKIEETLLPRNTEYKVVNVTKPTFRGKIMGNYTEIELTPVRSSIQTKPEAEVLKPVAGDGGKATSITTMSDAEASLKAETAKLSFLEARKKAAQAEAARPEGIATEKQLETELTKETADNKKAILDAQKKFNDSAKKSNAAELISKNSGYSRRAVKVESRAPIGVNYMPGNPFGKWGSAINDNYIKANSITTRYAGYKADGSPVTMKITAYNGGYKMYAEAGTFARNVIVDIQRGESMWDAIYKQVYNNAFLIEPSKGQIKKYGALTVSQQAAKITDKFMGKISEDNEALGNKIFDTDGTVKSTEGLVALLTRRFRGQGIADYSKFLKKADWSTFDKGQQAWLNKRQYEMAASVNKNTSKKFIDGIMRASMALRYRSNMYFRIKNGQLQLTEAQRAYTMNELGDFKSMIKRLATDKEFRQTASDYTYSLAAESVGAGLSKQDFDKLSKASTELADASAISKDGILTDLDVLKEKFSDFDDEALSMMQGGEYMKNYFLISGFLAAGERKGLEGADLDNYIRNRFNTEAIAGTQVGKIGLNDSLIGQFSFMYLGFPIRELTLMVHTIKGGGISGADTKWGKFLGASAYLSKMLGAKGLMWAVEAPWGYSLMDQLALDPFGVLDQYEQISTDWEDRDPRWRWLDPLVEYNPFLQGAITNSVVDIYMAYRAAEETARQEYMEEHDGSDEGFQWSIWQDGAENFNDIMRGLEPVGNNLLNYIPGYTTASTASGELEDLDRGYRISMNGNRLYETNTDFGNALWGMIAGRKNTANAQEYYQTANPIRGLIEGGLPGLGQQIGRGIPVRVDKLLAGKNLFRGFREFDPVDTETYEDWFNGSYLDQQNWNTGIYAFREEAQGIADKYNKYADKDRTVELLAARERELEELRKKLEAYTKAYVAKHPDGFSLSKQNQIINILNMNKSQTLDEMAQGDTYTDWDAAQSRYSQGNFPTAYGLTQNKEGEITYGQSPQLQQVLSQQRYGIASDVAPTIEQMYKTQKFETPIGNMTMKDYHDAVYSQLQEEWDKSKPDYDRVTKIQEEYLEQISKNIIQPILNTYGSSVLSAGKSSDIMQEFGKMLYSMVPSDEYRIDKRGRQIYKSTPYMTIDIPKWLNKNFSKYTVSVNTTNRATKDRLKSIQNSLDEGRTSTAKAKARALIQDIGRGKASVSRRELEWLQGVLND